MKQLLEYGNKLSASNSVRATLYGGDVVRGGNTATVRHLTGLIATTSHRRVPLFNDPDGVRIILRIRMHKPIQRRPTSWCALCGTSRNRATGHRSALTIVPCVPYTASKGPWTVWNSLGG